MNGWTNTYLPKGPIPRTILAISAASMLACPVMAGATALPAPLPVAGSTPQVGIVFAGPGRASPMATVSDLGIVIDGPVSAPTVGAVPLRGGRVAFAASDGSVTGGDSSLDHSTISLNAPIVGIASAPDGAGYWEVASDGGVFAYGDAGFYGSTGSMRLNQPIVGMASTPDGLGYWLVARDGGVFAFGDAGFYGSTGAMSLNQPIVAMAGAPSGAGYLLTASDGGVFAFGDTAYAGRLAGPSPVVGIATNPTGPGYWEVAQDGTVGAFGGAPTIPGLTGAGGAIGIFAIALPPTTIPGTGVPPGAPTGPVSQSPAAVAADIQAIVATLPAGLTPPGWTWQVVPSLSENVNGVLVYDTGQTSWGDPPVSTFSAAELSTVPAPAMATVVWHEWANAVVMSRVQTLDWANVPASEVPWAATWAAQAVPLLQGAASGCEIIDEASDSLTASLGGPTVQGCGGTATPALDTQLLADIEATAPGYAS